MGEIYLACVSYFVDSTYNINLRAQSMLKVSGCLSLLGSDNIDIYQD